MRLSSARIRIVAVALAALVVAQGASADGGRSVEATWAQADPLEGVEFYVDREAPAWLAWRRATGRQKDLLWKIAREPKGLWYGKFTRPADQFRGKVRRPIDEAERQGTVPLLTVLRAESIQCNPGYQAGGPAEDAATRAWYDKFAQAIGSSRVVIAFEPDSIGTIRCHAASRRDDRIRLLRYGVDRLSQLPNATVYIEAGASDWMAPAKTARLLRKVGVAKVRGFMLNATHYDWTAANVRHGLKISRKLGGKHFVINTAENGRGPYRVGTSNVWCNPPGRGLGPAPTTDTAHPMVDAYLWINRPGYGQSCAGQKIAWNMDRALAYASRATTWEKPPGR
jgi:endoglucanase